MINPNGAIRQIEKGQDLKYVCQSWLYDYQASPEMNLPGLVNDDYFFEQHVMINYLLHRASKAGSAYLMHEPGHPHLYRGWMCAEPFKDLPVVHFIKVKKGAMHQGVATALMEQFYKDFGYEKGQNCVYTHSAKDIKRRGWLQHSMRDWSSVYYPWLKYELVWEEKMRRVGR